MTWTYTGHESANAMIEFMIQAYRPRIMKYLSDLQYAMILSQWTGINGIDDITDAEFRCSVNGKTPQGYTVEFIFEVLESMVNDRAEPFGINFGVTIVGQKASGHLWPWNGTQKVWVDVRNDDAVEKRFLNIERDNPPESLIRWAESR